jgi:hypothetical protein
VLEADIDVKDVFPELTVIPEFAVYNPFVLKVVNDPDDAVVIPIGPGFANVFPLSVAALKLATVVVEAITKGAVPVDTVEVI